MNIPQTVREARREAMSLQTARNWHDNHYEHTTPDSHQGRWRPFIEIDPFNPENRLEGHIQIQGGDEYGTLAIQTVNKKPAPQFINTMPKATYPFFKDGSWVLTGMDSLEAYCKLDGTNIVPVLLPGRLRERVHQLQGQDQAIHGPPLHQPHGEML